MNLHAIYHIAQPPYAYGKNEEELVVRIRTARDDIKNINILYKDRYVDTSVLHTSKQMYKKESTNLFDFFEAVLYLDTKRFRYLFELEDINGQKMYYGERGFNKEMFNPNDKGNFQFPYLCEQDILESVKWGSEGVVYQIFPDRFYNGDTSNDLPDTRPWGEKPTRENTFGGDLKGIIKKLDYLEDLGVDIIYMTPIFESSSNHKYNTKDYYKIDPQFGDLDTIKELVDKAHEKGMKVILDAVFNHSGDDFFAFKDVVENEENSKYKDWFYIKEFPIVKEPVPNYRVFGDNHAYMPKFKTSNPEVRRYLLDIAKYWILEIGIDGWRLDVCDEVDHYFWREFRKVVKEVNKDALIIGEIMHESTNFLRGDQLDSIMNYPFQEAVIDFFAKEKIDSKEFDSLLAGQRASYMDTVNYQMWNLVDSHDTARFLTMCQGDVDKVKLAAAFQFSYIGTPYIYYGGEIGMEGENDPDCRRCMIWDEEKQNKDLYNTYKKLINIRKNNKALVYGEYKTIYSEDNILFFKRTYENEDIYILINNSKDKKTIDIGLTGDYIELFSEENLNIEQVMEIEPMNFKILKKGE